MHATQRLRAGITRWLIAVVLLALLLVPAAMQMNATRDNALHGGFRTTASAKPRFAVRGSVKGLYPGKRKPMKLKIKNLQRYPIKVKNLKVKVGRSTKRGCSKRWIRPKRQMRISLKVPARARAFVSYPVRMPKKAPNACQGARWKLKYKGKAVRAR
ncbi:MAG: hypothetical protein ACRDJV_00250 [Actinomycetota bacterium]